MSLNDLRLSANMPGDNFGATVAGDGKIKRLSLLKRVKGDLILGLGLVQYILSL